MTTPVSAPPVSDPTRDDASAEALIALADSLVAFMQQGVAEQAWECLPQLADQLQSSLRRLDQCLHTLAVADPARAVSLAPVLAGVAGRHAVVLEHLTAARDDTAAQLGAALHGHSGAAHYLNAAGGA